MVLEPLHWHTIVNPRGSHKDDFGVENRDHIFYGTNYSWLMYLALFGVDVNSYDYKGRVCRKLPLSAMMDHDWLGLKNTLDIYKTVQGSVENSHGHNLSFLEIGNYAFAITAFRNTDLCQQSKYDDVSTVPSRAPKESEGTWYIHKTYRTKHLTDTGIDYTGDGQFTLPSVTNTISVEAEPPTGYTVVGWRTSTSDPINPDYNNWEGTIPGVVQTNGASNKIKGE